MKQLNLVITLKRYNQLFEKLKLICLKTDPKKTALAITLGTTLGIMPVIGFTFILITFAGFIFRLNQVILQTIHILVSPLQIILIPVFVKAGQVLFQSSHEIMIQNSGNPVPLNFFQLISQFGHLIVYGLIVWVLFSGIFGYILYRILLKRALIQNRNNSELH